MVFSSLIFLIIFLPVTLIGYFVLPKRCRNTVLLIASLVFYAWGEPIYVFLMILSILVNYVLGVDIGRSAGARRTVLLIAAIIVDLLTLGFFKYYGFVVDTINGIFSLSLPVRELALPIGISFYTFQILSYIIDVYRGRVEVQKNPLRFALYVTMFPQLIAGPIVRYAQIEKELTDRIVTPERVTRGAEIFLFGLAKKVLLANTLGALFTSVQGADGRTALTAWIGMTAYALQIYFDFSGYSDMAIGLGHIFGFTFPQNFDHPYIAASITDFWRRWHMTLGGWFREYVYIPMGGNRVRPWRHVCNILVVWALTGLWHGAAWNFVLWGLYYGVLLLLEKYLFRKVLDKCPAAIRHIYTLFFVMIGWVLFAAGGLSEAAGMLADLFGRHGLADLTAAYALRSYGLWIAAGILCALPQTFSWYRRRTHDLPALTVLIGAALIFLCIASLVAGSYNPFLYFRF